MLGRSEGKGKRVQASADGNGSALESTTITTADGQVLTVAEFISRFDEAAKRRMERMNKKLSDLELQMEVIEAEMCKANKISLSWTD